MPGFRPPEQTWGLPTRLGCKKTFKKNAEHFSIKNVIKGAVEIPACKCAPVPSLAHLSPPLPPLLQISKSTPPTVSLEPDTLSLLLPGCPLLSDACGMITPPPPSLHAMAPLLPGCSVWPLVHSSPGSHHDVAPALASPGASPLPTHLGKSQPVRLPQLTPRLGLGSALVLFIFYFILCDAS